MWLSIGILTMFALLIIVVVALGKHGKFKYVVYGSAAFLWLLMATALLYSVLFQGANLSTPMFGVNLTSVGFPSNRFDISEVATFVWYGQLVFITGALVFFWCIMCGLVTLLLALNGGDTKETASLFK